MKRPVIIFVFLALIVADAHSQPPFGEPYSLKIKSKYHYGVLDTFVTIDVISTDTCFWTDTTVLNVFCDASGAKLTVKVDSSHAIAYGTVLNHDDVWMYLGFRVNLSCGTAESGNYDIILTEDQLSVKQSSYLSPDVRIARVNSQYVFSFQGGNSSTTRISLFDEIGRRVQTFEFGEHAGWNDCPIDISSLPSGYYWYSVRSEDFSKRGRLFNW
jgi:hypothetical protein